MSMFHELMMRKKEEIMYATIKGSPTESPSGVFSGFSDSNYLELQQPFAPTGSWEVVICVTPTTYTLNHTKYFFGCYGTGNIVLGTTTSSKFKLFISTNNGSSYNIQLTTTENIVADTLYYVKVGFNGSKYYIEQSIDGKTYIGRSEQASSDSISSATVYIGKAYQDGYYWTNTVNLNNSYIKLGSTKYNLQAVVGYTVVGSPTITDGVVSGFSSANYLTLTTSPNLSEETEIVTKINRNSNNNVQFIMGWESDAVYSVGIYLSAGKIIVNYQRSADGSNQRLLLGTKVYDGNTDYYIKLIKTSNSLSIFYSINGKDWEQDAIAEFTDMPSFVVTRFRVGVGADTTPNAPFDGSIYINETYIKINNKLWFNGQQA